MNVAGFILLSQFCFISASYSKQMLYKDEQRSNHQLLAVMLSPFC